MSKDILPAFTTSQIAAIAESAKTIDVFNTTAVHSSQSYPMGVTQL